MPVPKILGKEALGEVVTNCQRFLDSGEIRSGHPPGFGKASSVPLRRGTIHARPGCGSGG